MSFLRGYPQDPMHNGYARIPDPADREPNGEDDLGVCVHGESGQDCDACMFGRAVDYFDAGGFDS